MRHFFPVLFWPFFAMAAHNENYKINLDWNDSRSLTDSVVQMCDDSYYPAVEIKIPGNPHKTFSIEMAVDISAGKLSPGCTVKKKQAHSATTYIFDASGGGCTITVYERGAPKGGKPRTATYELHDAC